MGNALTESEVFPQDNRHQQQKHLRCGINLTFYPNFLDSPLSYIVKPEKAKGEKLMLSYKTQKRITRRRNRRHLNHLFTV